MLDDYVKARKRGEKEYRRAVAAGRYPYLPALDDIMEPSRAYQQVSLGINEVPLSMIVGTKTAGRRNVFSSGFMPLLDSDTEFGQKWIALYDSQIENGIRDPIRAYEYMNRFYVLEGNKRVSVMKYLGAYAIRADVIRIMPEHNQNLENEIYYEFVAFYQVTRMNEILFSGKGRYAALAKVFGQDLEKPWPQEAIDRLNRGFLTFTFCMEKKNPASIGQTMGDAFLLYLQIFTLDSLIRETKDTLLARIDKLWMEMLAQANANNIDLQEWPEDLPAGPSQSLLGRLFAKAPAYTEYHPLKAAFLYEKTQDASGWVYGHELGRSEVSETFEGIVQTCKYEGLTEDSLVEQALNDAAAKGCECLFTTSASMMPAAMRFAVENPDIRVLNCSVNLAQHAVRTYYSRMYEAKFLMGALAASLTDSPRIGYVADYPVYGDIASINAFAIGAAMVRPDARIILRWSAEKDVDWHKDFSWENISIISGPDFIRPRSQEREYGLYLKKGEELTRLAAPIRHWGKYYVLILKSILSGAYDALDNKNGQPINYWYGMASGVIDIILSQKLSRYSQKLVDVLRREVISGELNPFEGELRSQDGKIYVPEGETLSSDEIIRMDFLNENVVGEIPRPGKIVDSAKKTVSISGVPAAKEPEGQSLAESMP